MRGMSWPYKVLIAMLFVICASAWAVVIYSIVANGGSK